MVSLGRMGRMGRRRRKPLPWAPLAVVHPSAAERWMQDHLQACTRASSPILVDELDLAQDVE